MIFSEGLEKAVVRTATETLPGQRHQSLLAGLVASGLALVAAAAWLRARLGLTLAAASSAARGAAALLAGLLLAAALLTRLLLAAALLAWLAAWLAALLTAMFARVMTHRSSLTSGSPPMAEPYPVRLIKTTHSGISNGA